MCTATLEPEPKTGGYGLTGKRSLRFGPTGSSAQSLLVFIDPVECLEIQTVFCLEVKVGGAFQDLDSAN